MLDLSSDMQAAVSEPDDAPRGLLRISVSTSFGQAQLADAMAAYVKRYPGVSIDLQMLDRTVNPWMSASTWPSAPATTWTRT